MGLEIGCRIKKRSEKCPYQAIKEVEDNIERAKKILCYIEEKTKRLERALKKVDLQVLYELNSEYHDGFRWQKESLLEVPMVIQEIKNMKERDTESCPYTLQTCEDILYLKSSRAKFLRKKITQATSYYNEIIMILNEALRCYKSSETAESDAFFSYQGKNRPCLIYSNMKLFKPNEAQDNGLDLFYFDEKKFEVRHYQVKCHYNPYSLVLKGTYLGKASETHKLIEIYLPNEMNKMIQRQLIQGIQAWIKHINHLYGRRFGKIQGSFLLLCNYPEAEQMKLATELKHMGYKSIGHMNEIGEFEEQSILIHIIHSLEGRDIYRIE